MSAIEELNKSFLADLCGHNVISAEKFRGIHRFCVFIAMGMFGSRYVVTRWSTRRQCLSDWWYFDSIESAMTGYMQKCAECRQELEELRRDRQRRS